jgi:Family of unknown function (DUF5681)
MAKFQKGVSGNPGGRPKRVIGDLSAEARLYASLALETIVKICASGKTERDKLAAARELLDRGFGKPVQAVDLILMAKKVTELSDYELEQLQLRLASVSVASQAPQLMLAAGAQVDVPAETEAAP